MEAKICLALTCATLDENLSVLKFYKESYGKPDLLELRVDFLNYEEIFNVHEFPALVDIPVILTIRREEDGGRFIDGEYKRSLMFVRCLNIEANNKSRFEYIDLEDGFNVDEIEEVCYMHGIKIIRSYHSVESPILDYESVIKRLKRQRHDIIKIASYSTCLKDTEVLFKSAEYLKGTEHLLVAMGEYGFISRILATKFGSKWTYSFSYDAIKDLGLEGEMVEPEMLAKNFNFYNIFKNTPLFGIIGASVNMSCSPHYHNSIFRCENIKCAYVPLSAKNIEEAMEMCNFLGIKGMSVTAPFKLEALQYASEIDESVKIVGATNTLTCFGKWFHSDIKAYNTDIVGFEKALKEFLAYQFDLSLRVSVLGAGGAARAVCYVLNKLGFRNVVIFNRTYEKARILALQYGYEAALLDSVNVGLLKDYSNLIINTTSTGVGKQKNVDILPFYRFVGDELVFDLVYNASSYSHKKSSLLEKARGCKTCDGYLMFRYQAMEQARLFYENMFSIN